MPRRHLDQYTADATDPTEYWLTRALLKHVTVRGSMYEPCVGSGNMVRAAREFKRPHGEKGVTFIWTNDYDDKFEADTYMDAQAEECWQAARTGLDIQPGSLIPWVVTNPPFFIAAPILEKALEHANNVAFLLRLSFLEPTTGNKSKPGRKDLLRAFRSNLSDLLIFGSPRPSFTGDGKTDNATVAWMVWRKNRGVDRGLTNIQFITDWYGKA